MQFFKNETYLLRRTRRWRLVQYSMQSTCNSQNLHRSCPLWSVCFGSWFLGGFQHLYLPWQCHNWSCGRCGTRIRIVAASGSERFSFDVVTQKGKIDNESTENVCFVTKQSLWKFVFSLFIFLQTYIQGHIYWIQIL